MWRDEQRCFLEQIPLMQDLQSAWLLLLHCASARANYQILGSVPCSGGVVRTDHDENIWQCLGRILQIDPAQCSNEVRESATLALSLGGLGLRSAVRTRVPAFWANCLPMILESPAVAAQLINQLEVTQSHPS